MSAMTEDCSLIDMTDDCPFVGVTDDHPHYRTAANAPHRFRPNVSSSQVPPPMSFD
jgi:hypothetical protein